MLNNVILCGNLGADPELKSMPSGDKVCELRLATSKKWTDKQGNKKEDTQWHNVSVFGNQAESCAKYLKKGRQVLVDGSIRYSKKDMSDGSKRVFTSIVSRNVQFLGSQEPKPLTVALPVEDYSDIPF